MSDPISLKVDGKNVTAAVPPDTQLATFLREHLRHLFGRR